MTGAHAGNARLRLSCTVKETGIAGTDQEVILPIRNPPPVQDPSGENEAPKRGIAPLPSVSCVRRRGDERPTAKAKLQSLEGHRSMIMLAIFLRDFAVPGA